MKECASFFIRTIVESLKKQYLEITNLTVPAALLSYINSETYNDEDDDQDTIYKLVYDIGGGTLDVSIAKLTRDDYGGYTVDIVGCPNV